MKKILICSNPDRDIGFETADKIKELLHGDMQCEVYSIDRTHDGAKSDGKLAEAIKDADFIVAIGGDGSIMHTLRASAAYGKSVVGVNRGNKGFLADLDTENLDLLKNLANGRYKTESRMMLDISVVREGKTIFSDFAVNDMAVTGLTRILDIAVYADGVMMTKFPGDGVVVASPTGSTAYSMAAGGPIVEPNAENMIVTPICAHVLGAGSFVVSSSRVIKVTVENLKTRGAFLAVDGRQAPGLKYGDEIVISRSKYELKFIKLTGKAFYETVREKLGDR